MIHDSCRLSTRVLWALSTGLGDCGCYLMRDWNSLHSTSLRFFSMIMGFYDLWFNCCCFICLYLLLRIVFMFIFFLRRKHKLIVIFVLRVHCSFNNWNDKAINAPGYQTLPHRAGITYELYDDRIDCRLFSEPNWFYIIRVFFFSLEDVTDVMRKL